MRVTLLFPLILASANLQAQTATSASQPVAPVRPVTDNYFGTHVVDPYRYMENLKDPEVQSWFKTQDDYTRGVLARLPGRAQLLARIGELDQSVPQVTATRLPGDLFLIAKRANGENLKLYLRKGLDGQDRLLADPEKIPLLPSNAARGKGVLGGAWPSGDLKYVAMTIIPGGAENDTELHLIEVATGRETGDVMLRAVGSETGYPVWLPDNRSFVYGRYQKLRPGAPATEEQEKYRSYLHVLGTNPENDPAVFGYGVTPSIEVDPRLFAVVQRQPESKYALGILTPDLTSSSNAYYIAPVDAIAKPNAAWRKVADFTDRVTQVALHGDDLYLLTSRDAARYKVIRTDARAPNLATAETVLPSGEPVVAEINAAKDALYVRLQDGPVGRLFRIPYGPKPKAEAIKLPFEGTALPTTDPRLPGALIVGTSWIRARSIYVYDPQTKRVADTGLQPTGPYDAPANLRAVEVKVQSHDGMLIPLSIRYAEGLKLDGSNPTLLSGYGAYGRSGLASFDPLNLAWSERGGVAATCHVRGGGEYGEEWHLAGKGPTKPNTWRDFIACAEYLVEKKYTSPQHLAGLGGSAGGILIGRAITERPDLFSGAIVAVGVLDMLRSETTANGASNIPEFGSVKTEEGFKALYAMSAYHNVKDGTRYPGVLLTTGFNDPRVDSWEPGKMAARLQAATSSGRPVLLRVDFGGGHGIGSTADQQREMVADYMSFMLWQSGATGFQPIR